MYLRERSLHPLVSLLMVLGGRKKGKKLYSAHSICMQPNLSLFLLHHTVLPPCVQMSNGPFAVSVVRPDFLTTQLEPGPGLGACLVISFFDGTVAPPGCIPRTSLIYWWPRFSIDPFANSPSVPFCKEPSSSECSPVNRTLSPFRSWEGEKVG